MGKWAGLSGVQVISENSLVLGRGRGLRPRYWHILRDISHLLAPEKIFRTGELIKSKNTTLFQCYSKKKNMSNCRFSFIVSVESESSEKAHISC